MAIHAIVEVLDRAPGHWTSGTRLVAIALADYVGEGGLAWPSVETLARRTGLRHRQVQVCLARIEGSGWIARAPNVGSLGRPNLPPGWRTSLYMWLGEEGSTRGAAQCTP